MTVCVFIWLDMTTPPWCREKVMVNYIIIITFIYIKMLGPAFSSVFRQVSIRRYTRLMNTREPVCWYTAVYLLAILISCMLVSRHSYDTRIIWMWRFSQKCVFYRYILMKMVFLRNSEMLIYEFESFYEWANFKFIHIFFNIKVSRHNISCSLFKVPFKSLKMA